MNIRILCVGDIVGSPGRRALREALPALIAERQIDCVIANAENTAAGSGLTPPLYDKIIESGVDLVTLGDHIYRRKEIISVLESSDRIVKPANLPAAAPGREFAVRRLNNGSSVGIVSVLGRMFMKPAADCPFRTVERVLAAMPAEVKVRLVEVHAEATSEKVAMGWHLDGRVSAVYGTHTHVPTADERLLPGGTAYITDIGMTGPYDSVLGRRKDRVLSAMITAVPCPFDVADHDARLSGIILTVDGTTGRAVAIERVERRCG